MIDNLSETFRQSMRRFATTVSVITCASDGRWFGMTATAVTSLCAEPASVLVCINAAASLSEPVLREGVFCVNLLQSSQVEISQAFGGKARGADRFLVGNWQAGERGLPCLSDAQANLVCRVDGAIPYGTHRILIGRVESGRFAAEVMPLIYQDGGYAAASRLPLFAS